MATITTDQFLDGGTARTAGEAMTINSGGKLTIRTDTRVHANAPASLTGSLGSISLNEGAVIVDARNVKWLAYDGGSGNVPAIGTLITQGGVTGYLLGVWATLVSAPTAAGAAMPATGFLKFREVTGGNFAAGALAGLTANALGADVTGWLEVVLDQAANITITRLANFTTRGDWFYLASTTGVRGQIIQTPINGGGVGSMTPGVWIETAPGSGIYDLWPALYTATNGWHVSHIGAAKDKADVRQKFCKMLPSGEVQLGEQITQAATYASLAAQASNYASVSIAGTYVWAGNLVTMYCSTGHTLETGDQVGIDFTSGSATDGIYTVTVLDPFYYTVELAGSGTGGNANTKPGLLVTFTAHGLAIGNMVYCDFTTGTGVDGTYEVQAVPSANTYRIKFPHVVSVTSGAVSVLHTLTITFTAHGHAVGKEIYCDFTSGAGVDGYYIVRTVVDANNIRVNFAHSAAITTSNVTLTFDIGYVPPAGCKVRIPNIITRQCVNTTRAVNAVPHTTLASRPEFTTTSAGSVDLEFFLDTGWYLTFLQPYSVLMKHCATMDTLSVSECATKIQIDDVLVGMYIAGDYVTGQFVSNFAGTEIKNSKFHRGNVPGTTDHALSISVTTGLLLDNVEAGIIQFVRSIGYPIAIANVNNIEINDCRVISGNLRLTTCKNVVINDLDYVDRFCGLTNATTAYYAITIEAKCDNIFIDGITFGFGGLVENNHPHSGIALVVLSDNISIRNAGTYLVPLKGGNWEQNLYAMAYIVVSSGNNANVKFQRCFVDRIRTNLLSGNNTDKNILFESIVNKSMYGFATKGYPVLLNTFLNATFKNIGGAWLPTASASIYGTHFHDILNENQGLLILSMNEPTAETAVQFNMISGAAKFNSAGGILMNAIGMQAIWEDPFFRLGHTGFKNITPVMAGGTITNYLLEYQIDLGSGYSAWKTLNAANLSAEVINPLIGFRLKIRITTTTTNTTAITYLRLDTLTNPTAQGQIAYPLDLIYRNLTITNLVPGTEIHIYKDSDLSELYGVESVAGSTFNWSYLVDNSIIFITMIKPGYKWVRYESLQLSEAGISIIATQQADLGYYNPM